MKELASPLEPELVRIAAFSDGLQGGNPAGVWIGASLPGAHEMQHIAAEVGFSETAFAAPMSTRLPQGVQAVEPTAELREWRVRYFSPEAEVPFCGHATIALGVALARRFGEGEYGLHLNQAVIKVSGWLAGWGRALAGRPAIAADLQQTGPSRTGGRRTGSLRLHARGSGSPYSPRAHSWRRRSSGAGPEQPCRPCGHGV